MVLGLCSRVRLGGRGALEYRRDQLSYSGYATWSSNFDRICAFMVQMIQMRFLDVSHRCPRVGGGVEVAATRHCSKQA
jgi:hypothetical protein